MEGFIGIIIVAAIVIAVIVAVITIVFMQSRKSFREQKNYERGLKMVPLMIHLPPASEDIDAGSRDSRDAGYPCTVLPPGAPMRSLACLIALSLTANAPAQDLAATCHASSSYDLTVAADRLRFDRAAPARRRVELRDGRVDVELAAVGEGECDLHCLLGHRVSILSSAARIRATSFRNRYWRA